AVEAFGAVHATSRPTTQTGGDRRPGHEIVSSVPPLTLRTRIKRLGRKTICFLKRSRCTTSSLPLCLWTGGVNLAIFTFRTLPTNSPPNAGEVYSFSQCIALVHALLRT